MAEDEEDMEEEEEEEEEEDEPVKAAKMVEDVEDDEEGPTDEDIDFDAVAKKAVQAIEPLLIQVKLRDEPIGLEVGLSKSDLYLTGPSKMKEFDTNVVPGEFNLSIDAYSEGFEVAMPSMPKFRREVRGARVRPVNDTEKARQAKRAKKQKLKQWGDLPRQKMTPEVRKEWEAIQLRGTIDPKRFYKANDSVMPPKYFVMATEVGGGGLAAAGIEATSSDVNRRKGRSLLDEVMRDRETQEWSSKKYAEVQSSRKASRHSGHGKARAASSAAKSTRRGGAWKTKSKKKKGGK